MSAPLKDLVRERLLAASKGLPRKLAPDPETAWERLPPDVLTPAMWRHHVVGIVKGAVLDIGEEPLANVAAICENRCGIKFERGEVWVDVDGIVEAIGSRSGYLLLLEEPNLFDDTIDPDQPVRHVELHRHVFASPKLGWRCVIYCDERIAMGDLRVIEGITLLLLWLLGLARVIGCGEA